VVNVPILCSSRITQVTVYARGALVRRQVALPPAEQLPAGDVDLCIEDVTPLCEPGSVRAAAPAGSRPIIAVTSALVVPSEPVPLPASQARVLELQGQLYSLDQQLDRLQSQRTSLLGLHPQPRLRPASPREKIDERMADALATAQLIGGVLGELDSRLRELTSERELTCRELDAALLVAAQASSAPSADGARHKRRIAVRLGGGGALTELAVLYVVPAARFWPTYTLRISEGGRKASWLIEALCAQRSGEDWRDVRLALSTADLIYDARLPELPSLRLGKAQPPARRGYRPPPEGLERMFAGYDRAFAGAVHGGAPPAAPIKEKEKEKEKEKDRADDLSLGDGALEITLDEVAREGGAYKKEARRSGAPAASFGASPHEVRPQSLRLGGPPPAPPAAAAPAAPAGYGVPSGSMVASASMPMPKRARAAPPVGGAAMLMERSVGGSGGYYGSVELDEEAPPSEPVGTGEPQDSWLDFDRLVLGGPGEGERRGRLTHRGDEETPRRQAATAAIEALSPGEQLRDPQATRGRFDHRYDAEGVVAIPADGQPQRVALLTAETSPALHMLSAPRERPEVYREAELQNPCDAPLLAGPVDVYVEGSLLTTAAIEHIDRGGTMRVGMGVEDRLRVARNVRSEEETVGLLAGSTVVTHTVTIELQSALGQSCQVDLFERLPVSDDKSVTIELVAARPEASPYTQAERGAPLRGGLQWRVVVPPAGKTRVEYQYRITLPAKTEIVGGNRRD
jgi:hypothetical protein